MADLTYISFGAGVQSTALLIMSNKGLHGCPRADVAIFADTGDEPSWVYEQYERMVDWSEIPVEVVSVGCISEDTVARHKGQRTRFAAIPAFTMGTDGKATPLRRQCTREYKIEPIRRRVRELLGLEKGQHATKFQVDCLLGISYDEVVRMAPSRDRWIENKYPLVDARLRRDQCLAIAHEYGFKETKKSSCVFCPYHSNDFWRDLKRNHPLEWSDAVRFDRAIRDMSKSGVRGQVFLHRALKPLEEIDLETYTPDMFGEECAGVCGV